MLFIPVMQITPLFYTFAVFEPDYQMAVFYGNGSTMYLSLRCFRETQPWSYSQKSCWSITDDY